jgi:hypothetical protein
MCVPRSSGDAQVFQQSPKPTGEDWSFGPKGLHLVRILVHLFVLGVTRGRVLFHVMALRLLLLLSRQDLSCWALRDH